MAGRKTIMVDGGVWNKVEELKHNAYLRSSSDAIETAVDIASSDKYYAGIMAQHDGSGTIAYVVESLGKTEDEAVRNLLIFEQDSVFGDVRAEDIPTADETDIAKPGRFIVECTKRLYHAGKLFADPENWSEKLSLTSGILFTCTISKSRNGSLIADSEETEVSEGTENTTHKRLNRYFVLVQFMNDEKTARIIDCGTSPIKLHREMLYEITPSSSGDDGKYEDYNAGKYRIYPCTARLYTECIDKLFQSRLRLWLENEFHLDDKPMYQAFYGHLKSEYNERTGGVDEYIDTTPEGTYYAVLAETGKDTYVVYHAADSANKASIPILCRSPIRHTDLGDGEHFEYEHAPSVWTEVKNTGERTGSYETEDHTTIRLILAECTKELYCTFLMAEENHTVPCKIEVENGVQIATCIEQPAPQEPGKQTATANSTPRKKQRAK